MFKNKFTNSKLFSFGAVVVAVIMAVSTELENQREQKEFEEMKNGYEELKNKVAALEANQN